MRIAISLLNFRPGAIGGTETYLRELVRALAPLSLSRHTQLILICRHDNAPEFQGIEGTEVITWNAGNRRVIAERIGEAFGLWRSHAAERAINATHADVVLMPQQTAFPARLSIPYVLVVHDLQHLERPEMLPRFDRAFRPRAFPPALAGAQKVIAISDVVRNQLISRCGLSEQCVTTIRHGAPSLDGRPVVPFRGVGGPFLYYPAATHRHKGHFQLLQTFANLIQENDYNEWRLVLSGQQTAEWEKINKFITKLGLQEQVIHLGFLPFDQVLGVYAAAEAVVFPSEYEGLGLPVLEAGLVGKKIITSQLEVFEELGVPPARRIDFRSLEQLKRALASEGPALERPIRTWKECAEETLDVLVGLNKTTFAK